MKAPGPTHLGGISSGGRPPVRTYYDFESRLKGCIEVRSSFKPQQLNRLCSTPIDTTIWGIYGVFPGKDRVLLFEALEAYVGPIAGDRQFSRRMNAATHTEWVIRGIERLNLSLNDISAKSYYASRGTNGLSACVPRIREIGALYRILFQQDRKTLLLAALLHDLGKATGRRERHPQVGLEKLNASPEISQNIRAVLATTLSAAELGPAEKLIRCVIGQHDLIGGTALTRDRNIFEGALALVLAEPEPRLRQKALDFLALVNFADIDGQSENGIFTDEKVDQFFKTYQELSAILARPAGRRIVSPEELTDDRFNYPWWGEQRLLAWSRGDNPAVSEQDVRELIDREVPDKKAQQELFATLGRLPLFDGMYNLSTAIHQPKVALKFLVWIAGTIRESKVDIVTYNNSLLTNPRFVLALQAAVEAGVNITEIFDQALFKSGHRTVLHLSFSK